MPPLKQCLKIAGMVLIALAAALVLWIFLPDIFGWAAYYYFFGSLVSEGGLNAWLAKTICTVLLVVVVIAVRKIIHPPFTKERRRAGELLLAGALVAFYVTMYFCTRESGPKRWYDRLTSGEIVAYDVRFHPITGELLKPMTSQVWEEFQEQERLVQEWADREAAKKREKADAEAKSKAERDRQAALASERQAKLERERWFRESNSNQTLISSLSADALVLAVKNDPSDSQGVEGLLAELLRKKQKNPVSGVFKPAFYKSGSFDEVWNGDREILDRLGFFKRGPASVLLCKPTFSAPASTQFEGIVSVQGSLSFTLVTKEGRRGPWVFEPTSAPGSDGATARALCVSRLVEAIDIDVLFRK